ncbi:MAG: NAD kinase [Cytophagales bacterium]|nr:NAD kinase [Bernardetiaceae bacterium]MDW8209583.1 NAD kinase [Cytophagales bacterium]
MKIALHGRPIEYAKQHYIQVLFHELNKMGARLRISESFKKHLEEQLCKEIPCEYTFSCYHELGDTDLMLSIGGDGTLLETITLVRHTNIPILGINLGRLGFLATLPKEKIAEGLRAIAQGRYTIEERTMLRLDSNLNLFGDLNFALNECTISKRDTASMIIVHAYLDGEYLNSYWADGLIVATPTGSTAYSISVGGPVVFPHSRNFIISPISPHNLNVRPLVIHDECVLSFEVEGRNNNFLVSLDSRFRTVDSNVKLSVRKSDFNARLVRLEGDNFLRTLREKLNWGADSRN